jgi:hypothetical protein
MALETVCGFTKAALWTFVCWAATQPRGTVWKKIAAEFANALLSTK